MPLRPPLDILAELSPLRRYAQVLTRDATEAEDLVQDALLRAHERRDSFRAGGSLRVWLMAILHNRFLDRRRAERAVRAREGAMAQLAPLHVAASQEDSVRLAQIRAAFLRLPDDQREALHLVALEGMSYAQAAAVLGVPIGTLMSRISRARAALRRFEEGAPPETLAALPPPATQPPPQAPRPAQGAPRLRIVGGQDDD